MLRLLSSTRLISLLFFSAIAGSIFSTVYSPAALAQSASSDLTRGPDGSARRTTGVWLTETGPLTNTSNIPLPTEFPASVSEGVAVPGKDTSTALAPNTVTVSLDTEAIRMQIADQTGMTVGSIEGSVSSEVDQRVGSHAYAEFIELIGPDGESQIVGVRGGSVTTGPDGETLPTTASASVSFRDDEKVTVRFLNVRRNGGSFEESGVYFDAAGNLIVEDLQNGGDFDFDDGDPFNLQSGALVVAISNETLTVSSVTETQNFDLTASATHPILGFVELDPNGTPTSTDTFRFSADSDGKLRATYQLEPLFNSGPDGNRRPTLLNATLTGDPFANDNEPYLSGTLALTQFLTRTHRTVSKEVAAGTLTLQPINAVELNVDDGNGNIIGPGPGPSAYENLGGLVVIWPDGMIEFIAQWTEHNGNFEFLAEPLTFPGDAMFIPAIIAEQPGSNQIKAGDRVPLQQNNGIFTTVADFGSGSLAVIDRGNFPQNFTPLSALVDGVEDTLPTGNASVAAFDGKRIEGTVDNNDARTGISLIPDMVTRESVIANRGGLFLGANITAGIGNRTQTTTTTATQETTVGESFWEIDNAGNLVLVGMETVTTPTSSVDVATNRFLDTTPILGEGVFGYLRNIGGDAWTEDASTTRLEVFANSEDEEGIRSVTRLNLFNSSFITTINATSEFGGETFVSAGGSFGF